MKTSLLSTGLVLALVVTALLRAAPEAAPTKRAKAKADAARRTYEVVWKNCKEGFIPVAELVYRWSRRWLEADLDLSDKKADRVAAYRAHRQRMGELARITHDRYRNRINTIEEVTATEFYNAEADVWIEQALAK